MVSDTTFTPSIRCDVDLVTDSSLLFLPAPLSLPSDDAYDLSGFDEEEFAPSTARSVGGGGDDDTQHTNSTDEDLKIVMEGETVEPCVECHNDISSHGNKCEHCRKLVHLECCVQNSLSCTRCYNENRGVGQKGVRARDSSSSKPSIQRPTPTSVKERGPHKGNRPAQLPLLEIDVGQNCVGTTDRQA